MNEKIWRRLSEAAIVLLASAALLAQEDQTPRPPVKSERGLLQVNRLYYDLAANSGGDMYFWAPGEFASAKLRVPIQRQPVVLAYGTIETEKMFEIPVDTGVEEMTLFAAVQRKDLAVIVRPDGTVVHHGDTGTDLQPFQHMLIAAISAPAAGVWRLELHGSGLYEVSAHVKPAKDGPGFAVLALDDNGSEATTCRIRLSGSVKEAQLDFVTNDGAPIRSFALRPVTGDEYETRCALPSVPFRAVVRGIDERGVRFQRTESALRTTPIPSRKDPVHPR